MMFKEKLRPGQTAFRNHIRRRAGRENARPFRWPKIAFGAVGVALAVTNVTDVISVAGWFAGWFQFTGL